MVDPERLYCWTWDARPFPAFPALGAIWADGDNHRTGHWLTGRLGALASDEMAWAIAVDHGCSFAAIASAAPLIGGLTVSGPGTARAVIEPVLELTGQRLAARDGALVGIAQGAGTSVLVEPENLAQTDAHDLSRRRGDIAERPGRLGLGHFDRERDYLAATATALRPGNGPLASQSLPVVLDPTAARLAAERLLDLHSASGDRVEFALSPNHIALEPGDRVELVGVAEGPFEITEIRDGAVRRVIAGAVMQGEAVATGIERPRRNAATPMPIVQPLAVLAHLPPLAADPGRSRLVMGAYADPWPGEVRVSDVATGAPVARLAGPADIGETVTALAAGPLSRWDRGQVLDIRLLSGHPASAKPGATLAGNNRILVQTDAGDWEVVGFAEADLVAPGRYRLSQLLRGLDGSDAAMGLVSAGRRVMVLDNRVAMLPVESHWIGESRVMRFAAGNGPGDVVTLSLRPGPALPLAPVHLDVRRLGDGGISLGWTRRSRADADGWGMAEPALEHAPEAWRIRIFSGGTMVRALTSSSAAVTYGLAEQAADFGGAAPAFTYSIEQLSPVFGPGHTATGAFNG